MKKRVVTLIIVFLVIFALAVSAAAYFLLQARVTLFKGHVEQVDYHPGDAKLVLKVDGEDIGENGDLSSAESVAFPILTNVIGHTSVDGTTTWVDEETGEVPLSAPKFVLTAENGDIENVKFKITLNGDTTASAAMQFGVGLVYYDEAKVIKKMTNSFTEFAAGTPEYAETVTIPLGDMTIAEGEEVEIYISAWVNADALEKIGAYTDGDFTIDVTFFGEAAE